MLSNPISANAILLGILITLGLLSLAFSRLEPGTRAAGGWGKSVLLMGMGYAMLQVEGRAPTLFSVSAEIIMLSGIAVMHGAIQKFGLEQQPLQSRAIWGVVAASSLVLLWFTFVDASARLRVVVFSGTLSLLLVWGAIRSTSIPGKMNLAARRLFTGVIWGIAALFFARAVGTLAAGPHADEYFRHDALQPLAASIGILLLAALSVALMWMEVSLLNARLAGLASNDVLTGVLNHRTMMETCERELSRAEHFHEPLAVAMLDIDFFKRVNDNHGHAAGDAVLRHIADLIVAHSRKYDTCGRLGGEEFLLLMPQTTTAAAQELMETLRQRIEATPYLHKSARLSVTVSIGIAELSNHITGLDALLGAAERALYRAKRNGRNRIDTALSEAPVPSDVIPPAVIYGNRTGRR